MAAEVLATGNQSHTLQSATLVTHFDPTQMNIREFTQRPEFATIKSELHSQLGTLQCLLWGQPSTTDKLQSLIYMLECVENAPTGVPEAHFTQLFGEFCLQLKSLDELSKNDRYVQYGNINKAEIIELQFADFNIENPHIVNDLKRMNQQLTTLVTEAYFYSSLSDQVFDLISTSPALTRLIAEQAEQLPELADLPFSDDEAKNREKEYHAEKLKHHQHHLAYILSARVGFPVPDKTVYTTNKYDEAFILQLLNCLKTEVLTHDVLTKIVS
ncbi:hypothetical protein [Parashewanella tropica]|uniref:hypothetical protein n=1 Tax=Parashewanella tropica TaxID=2547970 RepID=UPI00105A764F|nr:hypothetical protein [Parashewanella tropica]